MAEFEKTQLGAEFVSQGCPQCKGVEIRHDESGCNGMYAKDDIPAQTNVVSCPISYVITPQTARRALHTKSRRRLELTDHQAICSYLVFNRLYWCDNALEDDAFFKTSDKKTQAGALLKNLINNVVDLNHGAYVQQLPTPSMLRTTVWFTPSELRLLERTNLHAVTEETINRFAEEWVQVVKQYQETADTEEENRGYYLFASYFKTYLWAATIFTSRAFSSSILGPSSKDNLNCDNNNKPAKVEATAEDMSSSLSSSSNYPILVPGLDLFNHKPNHPVTWSASSEAISLRTEIDIKANEQIFNNYGPKSNEVLMFAYGFTISNNEHDVIVLKLPFSNAQRHIVKRSGDIPMALLDEITVAFHGREEDTRSQKEQASAIRYENQNQNVQLEVLEQLKNMLNAKLTGLKSWSTMNSSTPNQSSEHVRSDVYECITEYRRGQMEILRSAIKQQKKLSQDIFAGN